MSSSAPDSGNFDMCSFGSTGSGGASVASRRSSASGRSTGKLLTVRVLLIPIQTTVFNLIYWQCFVIEKIFKKLFDFFSR